MHSPLYPPTPTLSVDLVPLALLAAALGCLLCLIVGWRLKPMPNYLCWWAGGGLLLSLSLTLLAWRAAIPSLSIPLGNVGMIFSYAFLSSSVRVAQGRSVVPDFWLAGGLGAIFVAIYLGGGTFEHRVMASSFATIVFSLRVLPFYWGEARRGRAWAIFTLGMLILVTIGAMSRGVIALIPLNGDFALYALAVSIGVFGALGVAFATIWMSLSLFGEKQARAAAGLAPSPALPAATSVMAPLSEAAEAPPSAWVLDRENGMLITPDSQRLKLTGSELQILQKLFEGQDEPVSRAVLNVAIGRSEDDLKDRSIDILISRLRRKCAEAGTPLPVVSVRGRGYVFHGQVPAA